MALRPLYHLFLELVDPRVDFVKRLLVLLIVGLLDTLGEFWRSKNGGVSHCGKREREREKMVSPLRSCHHTLSVRCFLSQLRSHFGTSHRRPPTTTTTTITTLCCCFAAAAASLETSLVARTCQGNHIIFDNQRICLVDYLTQDSSLPQSLLDVAKDLGREERSPMCVALRKLVSCTFSGRSCSFWFDGQANSGRTLER